MDRRTLLGRVAGLGAVALAGCLGDRGTAVTPRPDQIEIVDTEFSVGDIDHGGEPTADASVDPEELVVRFFGTIQGSDACKTAALERVEYDPAADEVHLAVRTTDRDDTERAACAEVLVFIDYEAAVSFDGGVPSRFAVSHDGHEIMSGEHQSEGAGEDPY